MTRILLSIQYDQNFDDFKIAKKIHQLSQLSKMASNLEHLKNSIDLHKAACEFVQTEIDEEYRNEMISAITGGLEIGRLLSNNLQFEKKLEFISWS